MIAPDPAAWGGAAAGDLERLLDPRGLLDLLVRSDLRAADAEADHLRWKPDQGALVGVRVRGPGPDGETVALPGYVRLTTGHRASALGAKWRRMRPHPTPLGQGVTLLADGRSVLFLFPNDARLRGLPAVADLRKVRRSVVELDRLSRWRVRARHSFLAPVRYKPERRFIARLSAALVDDDVGEHERAELFLRFFPDGRGARLAATAERLRKAGAPLPRTLGAGLGGRLHVEEAVEGVDLERALLDEGVDGLAGSVAEALGRLHRAGPAEGRPRTPLTALVGARSALRTLCAWAPELRPAVVRLYEEIRRARPDDGGGVGPIHGDLHLHQALVGPAGVVLVDLERSGAGSPLEDAASLAAHVEALAERVPLAAATLREFEGAVLDGALRSTPSAERAALRFHLACRLAEQALLSMRSLDPAWDERAARLLDLAAAGLGRPSPLPDRPSPLPGPRDPAPGPRHRTPGPRHRTPGPFDRTPAPAFFRSARGGPRGLRWAVFKPRERGDWPGRLDGPWGERVHGLYDPTRDRFVEVAPQDDPALPGLARWLREGTLVSYRPGRRATVRVDRDGSGRYVKVLRRTRAREALLRAEAAARLRGGDGRLPSFPRIVAADPEAGTIVFEAAEGVPLDTARGGADRDRWTLLGRVGESVAALHAAAPGPVVDLPRPRPMGPQSWTEVAVQHHPDEGTVHRRALEAVLGARAPVETAGPVHGDLHDRNILCSADGVTLIDLDSLHLGDPAGDLGNLAAHLVLRALQAGASVEDGERDVPALLRGYRTGGGSVGPEGLGAAMASTFLRLGCLYRFRRRWQHLCEPLLWEAERRAGALAGGTSGHPGWGSIMCAWR